LRLFARQSSCLDRPSSSAHVVADGDHRGARRRWSAREWLFDGASGGVYSAADRVGSCDPERSRRCIRPIGIRPDSFGLVVLDVGLLGYSREQTLAFDEQVRGRRVARRRRDAYRDHHVDFRSPSTSRRPECSEKVRRTSRRIGRSKSGTTT
jgi:hypothetical protein